MTTRPNATQVSAMAEVAGVSVDQETCERIAHAIGPALETFASVSGTMGMDLEPASFAFVQRAGLTS